MLLRSLGFALIVFWSTQSFSFGSKVNVTQVVSLDLYDIYQATGECKNSTSRDFYAKNPGVITNITKKQGKTVEAGEVILEIDGPVAKAMLDKTVATFKSADFVLKKDRSLFEKKLVSEDAFRKSAANFENAKHQLEQATKEYNSLVIAAPFDGVIGVVKKGVGDDVAAGDYLISVTDGNFKALTVHLPEKLLSQVKLDTKVDVLIDKSNAVSGYIDAISSHIFKNSGNFIVKIKADAQALNHGSYAKIKFYLNSHEGLAVPERAVMKNEHGSFVFVVDGDNNVKQTYITLGTRLDGNVEALTGLTAGQKVVIEGLGAITDGVNVEVLED